MSLLLEKILSTSVDLEAFPKAVVELYIMVLEVDGDPLGLSLMCASLALTDAGLNLFGLLGCCCVVRFDFLGSPVECDGKQQNDRQSHIR